MGTKQYKRLSSQEWEEIKEKFEKGEIDVKGIVSYYDITRGTVLNNLHRMGCNVVLRACPVKDITDFEKEKIKELYQKGATQYELAKLFEIGYSSMGLLLKNLGVFEYRGKNGENKKKKILKNEYENIVKLYKKKTPVGKIAYKYNVTPSSINYVLNLLGLASKNRKEIISNRIRETKKAIKLLDKYSVDEIVSKLNISRTTVLKYLTKEEIEQKRNRENLKQIESLDMERLKGGVYRGGLGKLKQGVRINLSDFVEAKKTGISLRKLSDQFGLSRQGIKNLWDNILKNY